eukprot:jgi/Ulvmu1/3053/UM015_0093.1
MEEVKKRFQDMRTRMRERGVSIKAVLAEMIGTAGFVLLGLLTVVYASVGLSDPIVVNFVVAFAFGIGIATMVYMTIFTSGGHLNPAITCAMTAAGVTPPPQAIAHIIGQVAGGIIATLLLLLIVPHSVLKGQALGANRVPEGVHLLQAFLGEVVGMFIIMLTILEVGTHTKSQAGSNTPLVIGLVFTVCILAFAPVSSASFNPARSLGPALLSGHLGHLIIYIVGPIAGALLSVPVHLLSLSGYGSGEQVTEAAAEAQEAVSGMASDAQEALLGDDAANEA